MGNMPGMGSMDMGPLMVMNGNDMGVRVGASDTNIMSMGAMGSGTTWQPSSGPMHMDQKQSGDWLLLFHYNLFAGMNRQGASGGESGHRLTPRASSAPSGVVIRNEARPLITIRIGGLSAPPLETREVLYWHADIF